jgi:putative transcriptional regulator
MKQDLIDNLSVYLLKKQFTIRCLTRACFDIVARKGTQVLLIKILEDANSINERVIEEMKKMSSYFDASPLIIADKTNLQLKDNVIYTRFGIYTLNFNTFKNCIENRLPFVKSTHAGLTADIIGDKLKEIREKQGLSLNSLAKRLGVSSSMVKKYENCNAEVTINRALRIYDIFGGIVFNKIDIFSEHKQIFAQQKGELTKKYNNLGFEATKTARVPFDIVAKKEKEIIFTQIRDKPNPQSQSLAGLINADNLVIFKKKKPKDIPSMTKEEFLDYEEADELIKFLKEF